MKINAMALAVALAGVSFATLAAELPENATETLAPVLFDGKEVLDAREVWVSDDGDLYLTVDEWRLFPGLDLGLEGKEGRVSARELGLDPVFDEGLQAYSIAAPATARARQRLGGQRGERVIEVAPQPKGALINYDIAARVDQEGAYSLSVGHEARIGIAGGTLITSGQLNTTDAGGVDYVRGISTWHRDNHQSGIAVSVGDVFTPRSGLTGTVNLAGVRVGSDRSLRPDQDFVPVPLIGGIAETRSATEIFVNGDKTGTRPLNPGPWEIGNVPVRPGSNNIRVIVRDEFGREQVIEQSFYSTSGNLPKGTSEWEVAAGLVRNGDRYDQPAATGKFERGLSDLWTLGGSIQTTGEATNIGVSNRVILGSGGALSVDAAVSQTEETSGSALAVNYEYRARGWGLSVGHARYSEDYWHLSQVNSVASGSSSMPAQSTTASLSVSPVGSPWSASLAAARIDYHNGSSRQRVDLGARWRGQNNDIGVGVGRDMETGDQSAYATWRRKFGSTNVSATARQAPNLSLRVSASGKAEVAGTSYRWSASAEDNARGNRVNATASARFDRVDAWANISHDGDGVEVNGRVNGSIWVGEGGITVQRASPGAFAVVEVPGQAGLAVAGSGGFSSRTNSRGYAVIPNIQPLARNMIRIEADDLDMAVGIENNTQEVIAGRRGGAKVKFELTSEGILELRLSYRGAAVPGPTTASTDDEKLIVGKGGVAFLTQPKHHQVIRVTLPEATCHAQLPAVLPDFEQVVHLECKEVAP